VFGYFFGGGYLLETAPELEDLEYTKNIQHIAFHAQKHNAQKALVST